MSLQALQAKLAEAERTRDEALREYSFLYDALASLTTIRAEMRVLLQVVGNTPQRRRWLGEQVRTMLTELENENKRLVEAKALHEAEKKTNGV